MTTWYRHRADLGNTIMPTLVGGAVDLVGATGVSATLVDCGGAAVDLPGTVVDPAAKVLSIPLSPWLDTAELDTYEVRFHVDFGPAIRVTWPANPHKDRVVVIP